MKKILHISFAFVFTVLTVGITINKHYSGGELFSVALYGEADSCCDEPCECCDDESNTIQFIADYLSSSNYLPNNEIITIELNSDYFVNLLSDVNDINDKAEEYIYTDLPPAGIDPIFPKTQSYLL